MAPRQNIEASGNDAHYVEDAELGMTRPETPEERETRLAREVAEVTSRGRELIEARGERFVEEHLASFDQAPELSEAPATYSEEPESRQAPAAAAEYLPQNPLEELRAILEMGRAARRVGVSTWWEDMRSHVDAFRKVEFGLPPLEELKAADAFVVSDYLERANVQKLFDFFVKEKERRSRPSAWERGKRVPGWNFVQGIAGGAGELASGLWHLATSPRQWGTVGKALFKKETYREIAHHYKDEWQRTIHEGGKETGYFMGKIWFDVASLALGGAAIKGVAKVGGKVAARAAAKAPRLAAAVEKAAEAAAKTGNTAKQAVQKGIARAVETASPAMRQGAEIVVEAISAAARRSLEVARKASAAARQELAATRQMLEIGAELTAPRLGSAARRVFNSIDELVARSAHLSREAARVAAAGAAPAVVEGLARVAANTAQFAERAAVRTARLARRAAHHGPHVASEKGVHAAEKALHNIEADVNGHLAATQREEKEPYAMLDERHRPHAARTKPSA